MEVFPMRRKMSPMDVGWVVDYLRQDLHEVVHANTPHACIYRNFWKRP